MLKQGLNAPLPVEEQVSIIYCGTKNLMSKVPVEKIKEFEIEFLSFMRSKYATELTSLKAGKLTDEAIKAIESAAAEISSKYE